MPFFELLSQGLSVWKAGELVYGLCKRLVSLWSQRGVYVAVFGLGGTGKTTLGQALSGKLDPFSGPRPYDESIYVDKFRLQGQKCLLLIPPGQARRRGNSWKELYNALERGKAKGVINVVSYGYHAFEALTYRQHPLHTYPTMGVSRFVQAYTKKHREAEIDNARELISRLKEIPGPFWMITLVTKQDLWWNDREEVKSHYEAGEYSKLIEELAEHLGATNFVHEYMSASLVISNFTDGVGERLVPTTAGYDESYQAANLRQLYETLIEFLKRRRV